MGAGGLRKVGEQGAGNGRNGKKFATLTQYFAIGKVREGGSRYGRGWEPKVQGVGGGMFRPPVSPPCIRHTVGILFSRTIDTQHTQYTRNRNLALVWKRACSTALQICPGQRACL